ncbi:MAG: tetratricopeptide repeat protein [Alphaproteobacteria bacterium]|nr:tetratricopeptide repeat protein [Alphaproteobacteria bacterium]
MAIDAAALFERAVVLHRAGQLAEAAALYRDIVAAEPQRKGAWFNLATALQAMDSPAAAMAAYRGALAADAGFAPALHRLGMLLVQAGDKTGARECFARLAADDPADREALINLGNLSEDAAAGLALLDRAVALDPSDAGAHFNRGVALMRLGRRGEAAGAYRRALDIDPSRAGARLGLAVALTETGERAQAAETLRGFDAPRIADAETAFKLGVAWTNLGRSGEASTAFARSLALDPDVAETHANLAQVLVALQRNEAALAAAERAVELNPAFAEGWNALGNARAASDDHDGAIEAYRRALGLDPAMAVAEANLGQAEIERGDLIAAEAAIAAALAKAPDNVHVRVARGVLEQAYRRLDRAIAAYEHALEVDPHSTAALTNLAIALQEAGQGERAEEVHRRLMATQPEVADPYFNLGVVRIGARRYVEAAELLAKALELRPDFGAAAMLLFHARGNDCDWRDYDRLEARLLELAEHPKASYGGVEISPFGLLDTKATTAVLRKSAEQAARRITDKVKGVMRLARFEHRRPGSRLTVGVVSPDFRHHSVATSFMGLLEAHDRARFRWLGFSTATRPQDEVTQSLKPLFEGFHELAATPPLDAARLIHGLGVDLLIDLAGHTRETGLPLFALRPARVQAHYLGYAGPVGDRRLIDWVVTDRTMAPEWMRPFYPEPLALLPNSFMATTRAAVAPGTIDRAQAGLPPRGPVLANFNAHFKFTPAIFGLWMEILRDLPEAVLWLTESSTHSRDNLLREAAARGVEPARLIVAPRLPHAEHLRRLPLADLALDTHEHSGGVTTVDALWMGVPVVTWPGNKANGRVGASLLGAIGMPELIVESAADYRALAVRLATDAGFVAAIKTKLRANRDRTPCFDMTRLARDLETGYAHMIDWVWSGKAPETFEIS